MRIKINNGWNYINSFKKDFLKTFPKDSKLVDLPQTVKELPFNNFDENEYQFISTYRKIINIEEINKDKRYFINFEGFMLKADIYLNGNLLGTYISGYLPVKIEVTKFVKTGNNELLVVLDSREDKDIPPFGFVVDYLSFGGIYRNVFLEIENKSFIEDIYVVADANGNLHVKPTINYFELEEHALEYKLYFDNKLISSFKSHNQHFSNVNLWDIDNPNLYKLQVILSTKDHTDIKECIFGFRTVEFKTDGFYLNKKKIKLVGLNRHQCFPYVGYAMPDSMHALDANILKNEIGINVVRCSHYPPADSFLQECDKIGLLVIDEVPGWQHIGTSVEWRNNFLDFIERMILKDRKFTSIISYGVRVDESMDDHDLYSKANEIAHILDYTRQTTGVRNFKNSELLEDIYSYNDFSCNNKNHGLDNPKTMKTKNKPYLVTECMGHMHPLKSYDTYEYRLETLLRYAKIIDDTYKYDNLCGTIAWCAFDYNTHKDFGSGDRICYHGVYDLFRNPKITSVIYKANQNNIPYLEVVNPLIQGDCPATETGYLYVASNADYIKLYRNNEYVNIFYPDKKGYPYTPHPLFKIDDYIGERFKENFSKKDSLAIKKLINYVAINGYQNLPLKIKLKLASIAFRNHLNFNDFYNIYVKYIQAWGEEAPTYKIIAYKNDKEVLEKLVGPSTSWHLHYDVSNNNLYIDNDYDVSQIRVSILDQNNNLAIYDNTTLELKTEGNISIIGPTNISLIGGQITIYIKSNTEGVGKLSIKSRFENKVVEFKTTKKEPNK